MRRTRVVEVASLPGARTRVDEPTRLHRRRACRGVCGPPPARRPGRTVRARAARRAGLAERRRMGRARAGDRRPAIEAGPFGATRRSAGAVRPQPLLSGRYAGPDRKRRLARRVAGRAERLRGGGRKRGGRRRGRALRRRAPPAPRRQGRRAQLFRDLVGDRYARLAEIKHRYDPEGLFFAHHGVGSEEWSADGIARQPS